MTRRGLPTSGIVFAVVVLICLAQVAWWIVFQFRESHRYEQAAHALAAGDRDELTNALGIGPDGLLDDRFRRQRLMFAAEGAFLGICALIGVVFFYTTLLRERRTLRERERFLTGAAHEFKTPLATIRLGLDTIIADRVPRPKQLDYARAMAGEVDRLERGVTNLLAAAGLRGARVLADPVEGDLVADIAAVVTEFRPRFETADVALEVELPETSLRVRRDRTAIRTVIYNLVDNALRYTAHDGSGQVRLCARSIQDGAVAEFSVVDNGVGMQAAELSRVFEPFYRGESLEHLGGSGLGLHLVAEFIRLHGGEVVATSDGVGRGSRFVIRLPQLREGDA